MKPARNVPGYHFCVIIKQTSPFQSRLTHGISFHYPMASGLASLHGGSDALLLLHEFHVVDHAFPTTVGRLGELHDARH